MVKGWSKGKKIEMAEKAAKTVAGVSVGAAQSGVDLFKNTRGVFYRQKDFDALLTGIEQQAVAYAKVREALAAAELSVETRKILFLDSLGLATGSILSRLMGRHVPSDVQQAYEMAYPQKAAAMDFKEAVNDLDEDQLDGFISGVKGKLFEIKYTDYLNDGRLPAGGAAAEGDGVCRIHRSCAGALPLHRYRLDGGGIQRSDHGRHGRTRHQQRYIQ